MLNMLIKFILLLTLITQIYAFNKTDPPPTSPKGCQVIKCSAGYKCDCIPKYPKTCYNLQKRSEYKPDPNCKAGCVCDDGYVLDDNYRCIIISHCPGNKPTTTNIDTTTLSPKCAAILCPVGSRCGCPPAHPPTCANPNPDPLPPPENCTVRCYGVCRPGYVLDKFGGKCVPFKQCPGYCIRKHNYEKWYPCSTRHCQRTCLKPNPICTEQCIKPGNYDCEPGYVRHLPTGRCITLQQCNHTYIPCPYNQVWFPYSTGQWERTCQRPNPLHVATYERPGNCDCKPPMVRDTQTCRCVSPHHPRCKAQIRPEFWYELV